MLLNMKLPGAHTYHVVLGRKHMHAATLSSANASLLAKQLCHDILCRDSLAQSVYVISVGRAHIVVRSHGPASAYEQVRISSVRSIRDQHEIEVKTGMECLHPRLGTARTSVCRLRQPLARCRGARSRTSCHDSTSERTSPRTPVQGTCPGTGPSPLLVSGPLAAWTCLFL